MVKVCCSLGQAKITYTIPSERGLKYRLKGQSKWNLISASEPLNFDCNPTLEDGKGYRVECNGVVATFNVRVLSGSYAIDWIHGYIPPFYTFTYGAYSYTDNDIFQAIGTLNL